MLVKCIIFKKILIKVSGANMKYTFLVFSLVLLCFQHGKIIIIYKAICEYLIVSNSTKVERVAFVLFGKMEISPISLFEITGMSDESDICEKTCDKGEPCSGDDPPSSTRYCSKDGKCTAFTYEGCGGNNNNFANSSACNAACPSSESEGKL